MSRERWLILGCSPHARDLYPQVRPLCDKVGTVNAGYMIEPAPDAYGCFEYDCYTVEPFKTVCAQMLARKIPCFTRWEEGFPGHIPTRVHAPIGGTIDPGMPHAVGSGLLMSMNVCAHLNPSEIHYVGFEGYEVGSFYADGLPLYTERDANWCIDMNQTTAVWLRLIADFFRDIRFVYHGTPRFQAQQAKRGILEYIAHGTGEGSPSTIQEAQSSLKA